MVYDLSSRSNHEDKSITPDPVRIWTSAQMSTGKTKVADSLGLLCAYTQINNEA